MTITTEVIKAGPFNGNNVETGFDFAFKTFAKADLRVVFTSAAGVDADQVLDSDYSVVLNPDQNNDPGGTVNYPLSGSPLASGSPAEKLTIINEPDFKQGSDLRPGTSADVIEDAVDRGVVLSQRAKEFTDRSIKIPVSDNDGTTVELPTETSRASKLMGFDSSGNVVVYTAVDVSLSTLSDLDPADDNTTKDKILSNAQAKVWEDYKDVGHLPLAGGTLTGALVGTDMTGNVVRAETSLRIGGTGVVATSIVDQDAMDDDSAVKLCSQQSIKKYVDDNVGKIIQVVNVQDGVKATGSTHVPHDNTPPQQSTEGDLFMSLAITPTSTSNFLLIEVICHIECDTAGSYHTVALYKGNDEDPIAVGYDYTGHAIMPQQVGCKHYMQAPATSAITFNVNCGTQQTGGVLTFNGDATNSVYNGLLRSSITIWEIAA